MNSPNITAKKTGIARSLAFKMENNPENNASVPDDHARISKIAWTGELKNEGLSGI